MIAHGERTRRRAGGSVASGWVVRLFLGLAIACGTGDEGAEPAGEPAPEAAPELAVEPTPSSVLDGTSWRLVSFADGDPVPADAEITLAFDGPGVAGQAACNRYTGPVEIGPPAADGTIPISFGLLAMTRMACPPPLSDLEARYTAALETASLAAVAAGRLGLTYATADGGAAELVFEPGADEGAAPGESP